MRICGSLIGRNKRGDVICHHQGKLWYLKYTKSKKSKHSLVCSVKIMLLNKPILHAESILTRCSTLKMSFSSLCMSWYVSVEGYEPYGKMEAIFQKYFVGKN